VDFNEKPQTKYFLITSEFAGLLESRKTGRRKLIV